MNDEPRIEIGSICPPIGSWFFPHEGVGGPIRLEQTDEENDDGEGSAQPS